MLDPFLRPAQRAAKLFTDGADVRSVARRLRRPRSQIRLALRGVFRALNAPELSAR